VWFNNPVLEEAKSEIDDAEKEIEDYRKKYSVVSLPDAKNILLKKISSWANDVVVLEREQINTRATLAEVQNYTENRKDIFEISAIRNFGAIPALRAQIDDLKSQRVIMSDKYANSHPAMQENAAALANGQKRLSENIDLAKADLRERLNLLSHEEQALRTELKSATDRARNMDEIYTRYETLEKHLANLRRQTQPLPEESVKGLYATGAAALGVPQAELDKHRKSPVNLSFE